MNLEPQLASAPLVVHATIAVICLLGLWLGSNWAVEGARDLARKAGVSELVVGLTIVSVISSLPEILINVSAGLRGKGDIAAGNVIGSCLVQITFVLGICAVIASRLFVSKNDFKRDGLALVGANAAFIWVAHDGLVSAIEGAALICAYLLYVLLTICLSQDADPIEEEETSKSSSARCSLLLVAGSAVVWLTAEGLVSVGSDAGIRIGVPDGIIGLWTGVGTSLPELAVSLMAVSRGTGALAAGNLIGSNITDPLLSLGVGVVAASGLAVSPLLAINAGGVWLTSTLFVSAVIATTGAISRLPATMMIMVYVISQIWLAANG